MRWLLIGITHKEIREKEYNMPPDEFVTLDRGDFGPFKDGDIDFRADAFDVNTWKRIFVCYGPCSFDVIMTDGGLFGVKRVDEIIQLKQKLLKTDGYIVNYMSPIGTRITCPFGRPIQHYLIKKSEYTIDNHEKANQLYDDSVKGQLLKRVNMII